MNTGHAGETAQACRRAPAMAGAVGNKNENIHIDLATARRQDACELRHAGLRTGAEWMNRHDHGGPAGRLANTALDGPALDGCPTSSWSCSVKLQGIKADRDSQCPDRRCREGDPLLARSSFVVHGPRPTKTAFLIRLPWCKSVVLRSYGEPAQQSLGHESPLRRTKTGFRAREPDAVGP